MNDLKLVLNIFEIFENFTILCVNFPTFLKHKFCYCMRIICFRPPLKSNFLVFVGFLKPESIAAHNIFGFYDLGKSFTIIRRGLEFAY